VNQENKSVSLLISVAMCFYTIFLATLSIKIRAKFCNFKKNPLKKWAIKNLITCMPTFGTNNRLNPIGHAII